MAGERLDAAGVLQLTDGTPVPGAELTLRCGPLAFAARTDADGRFTLRQVPEGTCHVTSKVARIDQTVPVGPNLLRGSETIRLTVPPVWRVKVKVAFTPEGKKRQRARWRQNTVHPFDRGYTAELDETIPSTTSILAMEGPVVSLRDGRLLTSKGAGGKRWDLSRFSGQQTARGTHYQVNLLSARSRPWIPVALRPPATGGEVAQVPLVAEGGRQTTLDLSAPRQLVAIAPCVDKLGEAMRLPVEALAELAANYRATGLRVTWAQVCTRPAPWPAPGPLGPILRGGPELLWALGARPGALAILDREGRVLLRGRAVDDAVAFLEKSWPLFAAVRQVSVRRAASVRAAESERLLLQAEELVKRRRYAEAHDLLDRALVVDPELAEARKLRAITRARLGDLSGALREVTWWRSSFGHESADDLMDEIQRVSAAR